MILPTSGLAIVLKGVSQIQNHLEGLLIPRLLGPNSRVADLGRSWVGPKNLHLNKFPGGIRATAPGTPFSEPLLDKPPATAFSVQLVDGEEDSAQRRHTCS